MDTGRNKTIKPATSQEAGRVVSDNRGRNVWQWNDDQLDSTTMMLARLDNSALALEPTRSVPQPDMAAEKKKAEASAAATRPRHRERAQRSRDLEVEPTVSVKLGGGFDPYNRG